MIALALLVALETPAPNATPSPTCATPYRDSTTTKAVQADFPESARDLKVPVEVLISVAIAPSGDVASATILRSSGNAAIDQSALRAARESTYAPKIVNCVATNGRYVFRAEFDPGPPYWYVAPPTIITVPSGWLHVGVNRWTKGEAAIGVDDFATEASAATARAETEARMKQAGITPVLDDIIRVCKGTADAWRLETVDTSGPAPSVSLYIMTANAANHRVGVSYDAPGSTVPDDVMALLESVCPPK